MPEINFQEDCILVGWSFSGDDKGVLVVGKQTGSVNTIINAFEGEEAKNIMKLLTTKKEGNNNG